MQSPRRIVSLISSATEILYLLGAGDRVVGVSHECDHPSDVTSKPRLTRSLVEAAAASREIDDQVRSMAAEQSALYAIDVELLESLEPELIITQAQCDVCAVRYEDVVSAVQQTPSLRRAQILTLNPLSLADVFHDIGQAIGCETQARSAIAGLEARVAAVRGRTAALTPSEVVRAACLEWIDPPMLAANWTPELIRWAGGEPGLTVEGAHSTYADWRQVAGYDPQVIVIMPCGFGLERAIEEAQVLPRLPGWERLSAVRERKVFAADGNAFFNRSGPRLVDSLEILAHLFHPDRCPAPDVGPEPAWRRLETRGGALVPELH